MTDNCIKALEGLRDSTPEFADLSAEQLLLEAIYGTSLEEVKYLMENTAWGQWLDKDPVTQGPAPEPTNAEHYSLEIQPAVDPTIRHELEDCLKYAGFDILGGGQNADMSGSDISFEKPPPKPDLRVEKREIKGVRGMSFGGALEALKIGYRVAREGWNGKGMWLQLEKIHTHTPLRDGMVMQPFISMKTVDDTLVPWLASQTDLLDSDWMIVETPEEN